MTQKGKHHIIPTTSAMTLSNIFMSPLRVDLMDEATRLLLRHFLQTRFATYHEDEFGRPAVPPSCSASASASRLIARSAPNTQTALATALRRPARGLITIRSRPNAAEAGLQVLLEISVSGTPEAILWSGAQFGTKIFNSPLSELRLLFSEDPDNANVFMLSCRDSGAASKDAPQVEAPMIYCFARDGRKWLSILRRRGVEAQRADDVWT